METNPQTQPQLELRLFGAPQIRQNGVLATGLSAKAQALLFYLAMTAQVHLRTTLASLLWGDMPERNARANLRKVIQQLRAGLGDHLRIDGRSVAVREDVDCWVDAFEFRARVERNNSVADLSSLQEAIALYRGDFLTGFFVSDAPDFEAWMLAEQANLRGVMGQALRTLADRHVANHDLHQAIACLRRIVAMEPWREDAHRQVMEWLAEVGERTTAISQYEICRQALREELEVEPGPATLAVYERLLRQEPANPTPVRHRFVTTADYALVGRKAEWAVLRTTWRRLDQPHLVCIAGEAGIGKTRLAEELLIEAERTGRRVARTRAPMLEGRLAYGPVADWLRTEPLQAALAELDDVWLAEVARVLPELLIERPDLPRPEPLKDSWQRKRLFEALAQVFVAGNDPLLLVLDDLQWCDADTLEWLHYLFGVADVPLLVVGTVRTEDMDGIQALQRLRQDLRRRECYTEIHLHPLAVAETAALAGQVADCEVHSALAQWMVQHTAGNPLFIIESVRAGSVASFSANQAGDADRPDGQSLPIPPKVYRIIQSRLALLSPEALMLAQVASVIGRAFDVELLALAATRDEESVLRDLDELWQRRIIREYDRVRYDFSHVQIREVVYAEINPVRRRLLHRLVGYAMEHLWAKNPDPVAGELAFHFEQAGLMEKAIDYYGWAAKVSKQLYAHVEVGDSLEKALACVRVAPNRHQLRAREIDLLLDLGLAQIPIHGYGSHQAGDAWQQAYALATGGGTTF